MEILTAGTCLLTGVEMLKLVSQSVKDCIHIHYRLANIGDCLSQPTSLNPSTKQQDIESIGFVMIELMEPATYASGIRNLRYPQVWANNTGIISFLEKTKTGSVEELQKHDFIPPKSTSSCLVPLVAIALFAARREGSIII